MPTVQAVKMKWNESTIERTKSRMIEGLYDMAFDIAAQARRNAPVVTGALRNSIRTEKTKPNEIVVIAGGMAVMGRTINYAWKREIGPNRLSSTEHYMENAAKAIMTGDYIKKYFGEVTK